MEEDDIRDYPRVEKEYILIKWSYAFFISFLIPFLGYALIIYRGLINWNVKTEERRQKSIGICCGLTKMFPIRPEAKRKKRIKAIGYFVIGILGFLFWVRLFSSVKF